MTMTKLLLAPLAALALFSVACDKAPTKDAPMSNELRVPGAPVGAAGKSGIADDGVKTAPSTIKPVAPSAPVGAVGRSGIPDDSIKPVAPVGAVGRSGIPDDSIKPAAPGAVAPAVPVKR